MVFSSERHFFSETVAFFCKYINKDRLFNLRKFHSGKIDKMMLLIGEESHYSVLGVTPDATSEQINVAYRRLARCYHPDSLQGQENMDNEMRTKQFHVKNSTQLKINGKKSF